jgi:hypothetical protein
MALTCCLCRTVIPKRKDIHALDGEWKRRHPDMVGNLACGKCVHTSNQYYFECEQNDPHHVNGARCSGDGDSWNHTDNHGTQLAMTRLYPDSANLQTVQP